MRFFSPGDQVARRRVPLALVQLPYRHRYSRVLDYGSAAVSQVEYVWKSALPRQVASYYVVLRDE